MSGKRNGSVRKRASKEAAPGHLQASTTSAHHPVPETDAPGSTPSHAHMAEEGRAEPCVAKQEQASGSAREEMSSGLKENSGRSLSLHGEEL